MNNMKSQDYKACKKGKHEFSSNIMNKYSGHCINCNKEIKEEGISKRKIVLGTILMLILILIFIAIFIFISFNNKKNLNIAQNEFIEKIEKKIKNVYENERAIEYGLTDVKYEIKNISKIGKSYEISIDLKCKANEDLTDTEKSLLAYAVEDYVPSEFDATNGYEITVRNSKNGFYKMVNTSINGELVHSAKQNSVDISDSKITDDEKGDVVAVAQREVKRKLKSPSSAKFPWSFDEYKITKSGNTFTVKSYVEANNSYGTKLKINYSVKFTMTGKETYIVENVIIEETNY